MKRYIIPVIIVGAAGVWFSFSPERTVVVEPVSTPTPITEEKEDNSITLLFVGDIMLSRNVGDVIKRTSPSYPFELIRDHTSSADIAFGNLENPVSRRGTDLGSEYSFRADPGVVEGLVGAGFDVFSLANNHMWDWGTSALIDTYQILEDNNIKPVGAGRTEEEANAAVFITRNDITVAFLAYTDLYPKSLWAKESDPGISSWDIDRIEEAIIDAGQQADVTVVSLHWGEEYELTANDEQRSLAKNFIDVGADLVIGHHPHVAQEVEKYGNGWIAYSLGNFVFDQNFGDTKSGLMLRAQASKDGVVGVEPITIRFSESYQPYIAQEAP